MHGGFRHQVAKRRSKPAPLVVPDLLNLAAYALPVEQILLLYIEHLGVPRRNQNGRLPRANEDRAIVDYLHERLAQGGQMKAAIEDIAQKFDVSRATVYNAWRREEERQKENLERVAELPPLYIRYD
jgi:hypothetical protein